jgi:asparagine synthase (glutamine-hydrolysing)
MCGICGQFNFHDQTPVLHSDIERMTGSIVHRGPDDEGYFISGPLGLGFRRLSIIDLGGGRQPMSDTEESVWIVFNGEIYNFPELRRQLESFGHVFRTNSDTEVIVHGYKQWGQDVLTHLNGMFGLAIWDVKRKRLTLARDPFGIKLIYYKIESGRLYFGSEIRAVTAGTNGKSRVDPTALYFFLRYRYTPSPRTMLEDVQRLAPGTILTCEDGTYNVRRWYRYRPIPFSPMKSVKEAEEELAELYKRAIKRHLLSDVPVGLLLSGGVDSGLLLALMNLDGDSWRTYTAGYGPGFADDELTDAEETAALFSSQHASVLINRSTFEEALPKIVSSLEEPVASSSIVPMYMVCERARQDVKVVLMGQGADELFGGYRRHLGVRYGALWGALPDWIRQPIAGVVGALPRNEALKRGVASLGASSRLERYQNVLSLRSGYEMDVLFRDGILSSNTGIPESWRELTDLTLPTDELGGFQFLEVSSTLPDELLMYADKLSMVHGLEVRVPYLDREIVEYVERLSANFKVRHGSQKWLHRRVCKNLLPRQMLSRKKRGFAANVVDDWFRSTIGNKMKRTLMDTESRLYRYLRPSAVGEIYRQHKSGRHDNHKLLFCLVVFEEWLRVHGIE